MNLSGVMPVLVVIFCFFAAILLVIFLIFDMMDQAEGLKKRVPGFAKFLEKKEAIPIFLLIFIFMLVVNGYELVTKEIPDVPEAPKLSFSSADPGAKDAETAQLKQQVKVSELRQARVNSVFPQETAKCWIQNNPIFPNPRTPGVVTSNQAIIFCNRKYEAPFEVTVIFDKDFMEGGGRILGSSITNVQGGGKQGTAYHWIVSSPSLLSYQPVVITANSNRDQLVNAVGGVIQSLH
jgi:hypothetical protein